MHDLGVVIHRVLDAMIGRLPAQPKDSIKLVGNKPPSCLPAIPSSRKTVSPRDPAQIRRKFELEETQLRRADWTNERLAQIPEESLAALAYSLSIPLQIEFGSPSTLWHYIEAVRNGHARIRR